MSTASDIEAQAAAWLVRRDGERFSAADQQAFDAWIAADPRHHAAYVRIEQAWRRADRLNRLRPLDGKVDEDLLAHSPFVRLEEFSARESTRRSASSEDSAAPPAMDAPESSSRRRWLVPVAAAAVLAVVAVAASLWFGLQRTGWQHYSTDFGGFEKIVLDDGSVVHLNTNSVMRVRFTSDHRQVVLDRGEALFKVAHEATRPFDVQAGGTTVRAVGTEFSVRVREARENGGGHKDVEVMVKEGRVAIDPGSARAPDGASGRAVPMPTLSAGETVTITAQRVHVEKVAEAEVSKKLSWTEGRLWFERQRLADVVAEFNRYNRRQMHIADPAIADLRIGGGFEATDPDSFIAALERTLGVRAVPSPNDPDVIELVGSQEQQP
ncbi:MAG TPA: FecR domain-containing protein [Steroidobacteraceae bacterium]|jgi:transmembrane sensor|nr:FecR domain-containing protein [Steroidobacteraceae bacterium]